MKKTTSSNKPQPAAAPDLLEIARELKALRASLATRDAEVSALRENLHSLHAELLDRDDNLQEELHDLESSHELARLSGGEASRQIAYHQSIRRIRSVVGRLIPRGASILVASKGHDSLVKFAGRKGMHFPQNREGVYSGFYPSNCLSAIAQLEALRSQGGDYLLFPAIACWWLEQYPNFRRHLDRRYRLVHDDAETCVIYSLRERAEWTELAALLAEFRERSDREPAILDWQCGAGLAAIFPECPVFSPISQIAPLPYADQSVDIVAIGPDPALLDEARRIASDAVIIVTPGAENGKSFTIRIERDDSSACMLPETSIIIPCHNGIALTEGCLVTLIETLPLGFQGEIIVVDDASTDDTAARLKKWTAADKRVRVLRNKKNAGFLTSANRGAAAAKGEFLIFLNNDTVPLPGWLPRLLRVFRDHPDAGAVGGRLIFPDGTMQEAGGLVFDDGSAAHFGRDDHQLDAPAYNFIRPVAYCSGALLATPRVLFAELGGFDRSFKPAYYEDTDYCFQIRAAGRRVYYQPEATVVHLEGASCGTDLSKGTKRYQEINARKFVKKWRTVLRGLPSRPSKIELATCWDLEAALEDSSANVARHRVLVCGLMPEIDRDSGSRRIWDLIVFLQELGCHVTFVSHHATYVPRYAKALQQRGIAVFGGSGESVEPLIATGMFDLAVFGLWFLAEPHMDFIRRNSPQTRIVIDSIDLHFLRNARHVFTTKRGRGVASLDPAYGSDFVRELNTYGHSDGVLAVSQKEADLINDLVADSNLTRSMPDNEDLAVSPIPMVERQGIVFIGCFRHVPNVGAVEFLCKEILPLIDPALLERHPVYIIGDGLDDTVRDFAKGLPNVRMVGWVPSVIPYLEHARITVIPLLFGAGTKRKMLQALMTGTPTVTTTVGAEGFRLRDGEHAIITNDAAKFAAGMTRLLEDADLWHALAREGRTHIAAMHGRQTPKASLQEAIAHVLSIPAKQLAESADDGGSENSARMTHGAYRQMVHDIRESIGLALPPDASVIVVSKGDPKLLRLDERHACHFPQTEDGQYSGSYPADSAEAIRQLETQRACGGEFLIFPKSAFWWLDFYVDFRQYLDANFALVQHDGEACRIYSLCEGPVAQTDESGTGVSIPSPENPAAGDGDGVRAIAFFLPQYHPIPENDEWWGEGFTEWRNVATAKPLFPEHWQPHLPSDLGFYDLRLDETREAQARLAREYGVSGFCYYHYWFSGKRLLERPVEAMLDSGAPDFPFCLCWANEPWSRRWDGRPHDVLQAQCYSEEDDLAHIRWLLKPLADPRAIKIQGKPVFIVYQARDLPDPARTVETWRREVDRAGLPGIYLMAIETGWDSGWDATAAGFDAKVLFQPQFSLLAQTPRTEIPGKPDLHVFDYDKAWPALANPEPVAYRRYDTVFPSWDNTARKGDKGWVVQNSTPAVYEQWLRHAVQRACKLPAGEQLVFINAWNEWAEGAHLEPDIRNGRGYLEATRRALAGQTAIRRTSKPVRQ